MGALVFLSCAPEDSAHRDVLEKHLAPLVRAGRLRLWHEGKLRAGEDRDEEVAAHLEAAAVVLLLVSADYLASEQSHSEMTAARAGGARVIPILLRPCLANREALGGLTVLPSDGRPVTTWVSSDDAWLNVAKGIVEALGPGESRASLAELVSLSQMNGAAGRARNTVRSRKPLDDDAILCLAKLEDARVRRRRLEEAGVGTRDVDAEILALKRQLREGGQVRQGDLIGGRYSLLQHIGRGGFATVWEAEDRLEHKRVALKVLHTNLADDADRTDRFLRGARVMADLDHPGIVRMHDAHVEDGGYCCFAMELLPGRDLQQAVVEGKIPRARIIPVILQIGDALVEAHARGYIHRDIKPANILLDAEGAPKLTDFDLVGDEDTSGGTRTGAMGTFVYAAPEVLSRPQDATVRADIFGLGMTALFCLHGRKLPDTAFRNPERVIAEIGDERVARVLRKAVEWDAADRYPSMKAFCDALRAAQAEKGAGQDGPQSVEAFSAPGKGGAALSSRWRRRMALAVSGALLAGLGALYVGLLGSGGGAASGVPARPACPEGMVAIPGGTFDMGSAEKVLDDDEGSHEVTLGAFCIDRTEVTVAAYRACTLETRHGVRCPEEGAATINSCGHGNSALPWSTWCNWRAKDRDDHPMNCVDWHMADTYCRWAGKRLPTEAQWEYAARGSTGRRYVWGNDTPGPGWLNACGQECRHLFERAGTPGWDMLYSEDDGWATTAPVGAVNGDRSAFDVRDMGGNVAEWVTDWYARAYPQETVDPVRDGRPETDPERVQRGLSWLGNVPRNARAAYRWSEPEESRCVNVGFRCARSLGP